jgi:hypothetical protein
MKSYYCDARAGKAGRKCKGIGLLFALPKKISVQQTGF